MKAGLYIRISTGDQSNYSLDAQEQQLRKYCKENNIKVFKVYEDTKGRFSFEERKGLMNLLDDVEKGNIQILLITELDRLAGDEGILGYIRLTLKKYNVNLISINEKDKVRNEYQELIESILTAIAKFENKRKKLRCRRGIAKAREEGRILNRCPYGYRIMNKGQKERMIEINKPESKIVKAMFKRYYVEKQSIYNISKSYGFHKSTLKYMLNNKFYWDKDFNGEHHPIINSSIIKQ